MFSILHPIAAFPINWILDTFGVKVGCIIGGCILVVGVWLRTLIEVGEPVFVLLGSVLAAVGNIFIMNSPSKLATQWFEPRNIPAIISLSILATNISSLLGGILPGLILSSNSTTEDIRRFLMIEAIVVTVPMVLVGIFLKEKPGKDQMP